MRPAAAVVVLAACRPPDGLGVGVPWLELPAEVLVPDARFDRPNDALVPLTNTGTAEAVVSASATPAPPFAAAADGLRIAPGATGELTVLFTPADFAPADGLLVVSAGQESWEVAISGTVDRDADDDGHEALQVGGDDCDEDDPGVHPGALELCDGVDQDCDDVVDDADDAPLWWPDADDDGHGDPLATPYQGCEPPPGSVGTADDCDDAVATVHPGAFEVWYDGTDQDCDGNDDDRDLDGHAPPTDCDDDDPARNPGAAEVWYDGTDQDCDGNDDDQDADGDPLATDCDDVDPTVGPSAPELDDGLDQDCDAYVDEGLFARGTLLVTELLTDPDAVANPGGRWLELHNPTDGHVDLGALVVRVGDQDSTPVAAWLDPGGVAVLCADADPVVNGGVACAGEVAWANNARAVVVSGGGLDLDEVDWAGWPLQPGASIELRPGAYDPDQNDVPPAWCVATTPYGAGDLGTPGSIAAPCP